MAFTSTRLPIKMEYRDFQVQKMKAKTESQRWVKITHHFYASQLYARIRRSCAFFFFLLLSTDVQSKMEESLEGAHLSIFGCAPSPLPKCSPSVRMRRPRVNYGVFIGQINREPSQFTKFVSFFFFYISFF